MPDIFTLIDATKWAAVVEIAMPEHNGTVVAMAAVHQGICKQNLCVHYFSSVSGVAPCCLSAQIFNAPMLILSFQTSVSSSSILRHTSPFVRHWNGGISSCTSRCSGGVSLTTFVTTTGSGVAHPCKSIRQSAIPPITRCRISRQKVIEPDI